MLHNVAFWVVATVFLGNLAETRTMARKCGSAEVEPRYAVDGYIRPGVATLDEFEAQVPKSTISHVEIICMNETDSTFNTSSGLPVVSVWTNTSAVGRIPATLEALVEAQNSYLAEHSAFATALDDLTVRVPSGVKLTIWRHQGGWIAEAGVERFLTRCFIYDGVEGVLHRDLSIREPGCIGIQWLGDPSWRRSTGEDARPRERLLDAGDEGLADHERDRIQEGFE